MKFYKNTYRSTAEASHGYEFFTRQADADKAMREFLKQRDHMNDCEDSICAEVIDIQPTKAGILSALRLHAQHADNG